MSRLGADATSTTVAGLRALGATFVSRYVSDFPWKNLTLAEAQTLSAAGVDLVTNWENDVNDWATGRGVAYAQRAAAQHAACGGPSWAPIYFSVDEKVDPNSPVLHQYFRDINSVLGVARTGVYGQTSALRVLRSLGLVRYTWRSMSTFGLPEGLGQPGEFDVEQTGQFNAAYDRDVANSTNFGQWRIGAPAPSSVEDGMTAFIVANQGNGDIYLQDGDSYVHLVHSGDPAAYRAAGAKDVTVSADTHAGLLAAAAARSSAQVVMTDAQAQVIAAAIASKLPTHITGTQTTTVTEDLT